MTGGTTPRFDLTELAPNVFSTLHALNGQSEQHARQAGVEPGLLELVRLRAAQLNGCLYCQDVHTQHARAGGEDESRLHELSEWRKSALFTERECAALRLAESVTLLPGGAVPEADYEPARTFFGAAQISGLVWVVTLINAYNRLAITTRLAG